MTSISDRIELVFRRFSQNISFASQTIKKLFMNSDWHMMADSQIRLSKGWHNHSISQLFLYKQSTGIFRLTLTIQTTIKIWLEIVYRGRVNKEIYDSLLLLLTSPPEKRTFKHNTVSFQSSFVMSGWSDWFIAAFRKKCKVKYNHHIQHIILSFVDYATKPISTIFCTIDDKCRHWSSWPIVRFALSRPKSRAFP